MCLLRTVFLILLAVAVAIVAGNAPWQGTLRHSDGRLILDLDRAPLWDPPPMPREQDFLSKFSHLPAGAREHWVIDRSVWLESMLIELLGALWIVFGLAGVLCVALPRLRRDPLLYGAAGVAAGLTASVLLCMLAWLAGGGWGPPVPIAFAVLGIVAGIIFAVATRPGASSDMAHPGQEPL